MSTDNYCVYCHTTPDGMQYIGVTCDVKQRWQPRLYKGTSLQQYIDKFGWTNIKHEVLYSGLTRDEALKREGELIQMGWVNNTCLNVNRSGHYQQTEEFKDAEKAYNKAYNKAYREAHPERCKAWQKAHPEEYKAYQREYYKRKKAEKQAQQSDVDEVKPTKPKSKHKKPLF